jgi:hypothetical protein
MNDLKKKRNLFVIHPILFSIYPILFIFSENIHLIPLTEIFLPIVVMIGITILSLFLLGKKINNKNKIALTISLLIIIFFSYGHVYNIINDSELEDLRHRYLIIPFFIIAVISTIYFLKSKKLFNNATTITNGIAVSIIVIISINMITDFSNGNFFGSSKLSENEKWFGFGASKQNIIEDFFVSDYKESLTEYLATNDTHNPDIYYIISDEYPNNNALKRFFSFDNSNFLTYLENNGFYVNNNSYSNYPTTIQSLTSSLNMQYLDVLTDGISNDTKNYHLLNELLSDNLVMEKFSSYDYDIINIGSLWGPNGEFRNAEINLCEFKEVNRDSLIRELLEKTMISYFYERYFEQLRRDQIMCEFEKIQLLSENEMKQKFIFVHLNSPHPPYIFGPNGESITPGNSLDSSPWNERDSHVNQIKFMNKNFMKLIPQLLDSKNKPIIILQGDTGSGHAINWESPSDDMIIERMSNLNAIYLPDSNYEKMYDGITPVNTFRIIFNEYFGEDYELHDDENFWSDGDHPYNFNNISEKIKNNNILLRN